MVLRRQSYEVLPALSVRRAELRRSLRLVTVAWMYGVVWMSCAMGSHVPIFARRLGFDEIHFGVMAAIPPLAQIAQTAAVLMIERTGLRKYHFLLTMTLGRLCWLMLAAIPLLFPLPSAAATWAMLAVLAVAWVLHALGAPGWTTWMGDLIPRRIRGRYLAVRGRLTRLVQIAAVIAIGIVLDQVTAHGAPDHLLWTISGLFALGAVFGAVDILLFRRIREVIPTTPVVPRTSAVQVQVRPAKGGLFGWPAFALRYVGGMVREFVVRPMKDRSFRYYVGYSATLAVAVSASGQFFLVYCLEHLRFAKLAVNLAFMVVAPLAAILSARAWGRLMDRWGRRPVLILATSMVVLSPVPYFLCAPTQTHPAFVREAVNAVTRIVGPWLGLGAVEWIPASAPVGAWLWVSLCCVIGGIGWSGIILAQTGMLMAFSDGPHRGRFVAGSAALVGLGGMLGGLLGGKLAALLVHYRDVPLHVGPFVWINLHATFALTIFVRFCGLLWLIRMPDPGSGRMRDLARQFGGSLALVTSRMFYTFPVLGWLRARRRRRRKRRRRTGTRS